MEINEETKINLLKDEYTKLYDLIDNFDGKTLKVKEWSITVGVAAIGGAYITKAPLLLLLSSFSAFIFWVIEYQWKSFQYPYFERVTEIERYFQNKNTEINVFQISHTWEKVQPNLTFKEKLKIFGYTNIFMPHIFTIIIGVSLYVLHLYNIVPIG